MIAFENARCETVFEEAAARPFVPAGAFPLLFCVLLADGVVDGAAGLAVGVGVADGVVGFTAGAAAFEDGFVVGAAGVTVVDGVVAFEDGVVVGAGVSAADGVVGAADGVVVGAGVAAGVSVGAADGVTEVLFSEEASSFVEDSCGSVADFSVEEVLSSVGEADAGSLCASV